MFFFEEFLHHTSQINIILDLGKLLSWKADFYLFQLTSQGRNIDGETDSDILDFDFGVQVFKFQKDDCCKG